jgi:hypothetical protein
MRRETVLFGLIIFFASCSNRTSVPKDILEPDSMRNIMKDVIVADAYSSMYIVKDTTKHDKTKAAQDLLEAIFRIHHTSREAFQKSLVFYESRPDLGKNLFDSLSSYATTHRNDIYRPAATTITAPKPGKPPAAGQLPKSP